MYELYHTLQKIWDLPMQDEIVLKNKTLIFAIILDLQLTIINSKLFEMKNEKKKNFGFLFPKI